MRRNGINEMTQNQENTLTPRDVDYWKLTYRELVISPEWAELDAETRARRFLEKIEAQLSEADSPSQLKALFECSKEENLKTARQMIKQFEDEKT